MSVTSQNAWIAQAIQRFHEGIPCGGVMALCPPWALLRSWLLLVTIAALPGFSEAQTVATIISAGLNGPLGMGGAPELSAPHRSRKCAASSCLDASLFAVDAANNLYIAGPCDRRLPVLIRDTTAPPDPQIQTVTAR